MRRPLIQRWTPEEDERLKAMVLKGLSLIKAAAALKRKQLVVRDRARLLGTPFPHLSEERKKWANTPNNEWRDY